MSDPQGQGLGCEVLPALSTDFLWGRGLSPPTPHGSATLCHTAADLTPSLPERSQCPVTQGSEN